jgi:pimeloyl-ACP methyl ester carboxylesterase
MLETSGVEKEPTLQRASTGVAFRSAGDGPPLFLLHGGAGSWTHWIRNIHPLGEHFSVHALDLPGYGESTAPDLDIPVGDYITIAAETVSEIASSRERIGLSGFSFGGFVAVGVASQLGERVSGVSLVGPAGFARPEGRNLGLEGRRRLEERLGRAATDQEIRGMHRRNLEKLMISKNERIDELAVSLQAANVGKMRFNSRPLSWSGRMTDYLKTLACPVIYISGDQDSSAHPTVEDRFRLCQAALPGITLQIIPDCGHWAQYEKPDAVNRILIGFHGRA